jgi:methionyl-tRNA synthetase
MSKPFYVTTPIYYVNDKPHLGHAYTTLACDVLARFMRLDGREVKFLTGTDEHGSKVAKSAAAAGMEPQAFADKVSQSFEGLRALMNFTNDDFIRTTQKRHYEAAQALWKIIAERGHIYLGKYEGWYSVRDEAYFAEEELTTAPDGSKRAPTGAAVEWVEEPSYFFRLSAFQDRLLEHYEKNPEAAAPSTRRNEAVSFIKSGLRDLSVSRTTFSWGIPVPGDEKHVMYVWFDALTNYITALGFPNTAPGSDYVKHWPEAHHIIGKDILRFHMVYWPAFLMAAGLEPPKRIFAHGWWVVAQEKMSKSIGNVVTPENLIARFGLDQTRYFLMREMPFGNDGDFSLEAMATRINAELANALGNLAQRSLSMVQRYCGGVLPTPNPFTAADEKLLRLAEAMLPAMREAMAVQAFHKALDAVFATVAEGNRYVDEQAPWALKKTDPARLDTVLYVLAETIRQCALLLQPFMPNATGTMLDSVGVADDQRSFAHAGARLTPGIALPPPTPIFPRVTLEETA